MPSKYHALNQASVMAHCELTGTPLPDLNPQAIDQFWKDQNMNRPTTYSERMPDEGPMPSTGVAQLVRAVDS